jgi:hypothetical protein
MSHMLGEYPPLPPALVQELHRQVYLRKARLYDWVWDTMANSAVTVFESYKRLHQ